MGFLSTVPSDANERMRSAVSVAEKANNNFPGMILFFLDISVLFAYFCYWFVVV